MYHFGDMRDNRRTGDKIDFGSLTSRWHERKTKARRSDRWTHASPNLPGGMTDTSPGDKTVKSGLFLPSGNMRNRPR